MVVKEKTSRLLRVAGCAALKLMNELQRVAKLDALKETIRLQRLGACTLLKLLRPVGCFPGFAAVLVGRLPDLPLASFAQKMFNFILGNMNRLVFIDCLTDSFAICVRHRHTLSA